MKESAHTGQSFWSEDHMMCSCINGSSRARRHRREGTTLQVQDWGVRTEKGIAECSIAPASTVSVDMCSAINRSLLPVLQLTDSPPGQILSRCAACIIIRLSYLGRTLLHSMMPDLRRSLSTHWKRSKSKQYICMSDPVEPITKPIPEFVIPGRTRFPSNALTPKPVVVEDFPIVRAADLVRLSEEPHDGEITRRPRRTSSLRRYIPFRPTYEDVSSSHILSSTILTAFLS